MRDVKRSALVPYAPMQMYNLVADFERYPEFVPWVTGASILERGEDFVIGTLEMTRAGINERFTTRNALAPGERIEMNLVQGPFKFLHGEWSFTPIQDKGTKIALHMRFEFANALTSLLLSRAFEKNVGQLVDAFVNRARSVYGRR
jgi:ribosome-associated toxin RatA of RatAB toxin-antitoxin module